VYTVGAPTAGESLLWQIAAIILTRIIISFGEVAYAAHQMGMQAESISYMPALGFSVAATAFVGQSVGAKDPETGKAYMKECIKGSILITSVSVILLVFFPKLMMGLLTNNKDVINLGMYYLILMGLVQIPQNLAGVFGGALRGAGYTRVPMTVAFAGLWGIRVPLTIIFTYVFKLNIIAIWGAMCADLLLRFILSYFLYKRHDIYSSNLFDKE
jgi:putative MATE family efflux protein